LLRNFKPSPRMGPCAHKRAPNIEFPQTSHLKPRTASLLHDNPRRQWVDFIATERVSRLRPSRMSSIAFIWSDAQPDRASSHRAFADLCLSYSRTPPAWLKTTPEQVVDQICKLAKKGATPSQIGVVLRDSHGIAQVKVVTGNSMWMSHSHATELR
jgi:hypothetical protein